MRSEGAYQQLLAPLATSRSGLMMLLAGDFGPLNERQQEYLRRILELDEQMIAQISSWADLDRLSKGLVVLDVEPCNIGSVIKSLVKADVELRRARQWPMVLADPLRLKQIIVNILACFNQVTVRARVQADYCVVTFYDQTIHTHTRRTMIISSMGFQVARLLAEAHGGHLVLNPHARQGTRLHLKLPLAKQMSLLGE